MLTLKDINEKISNGTFSIEELSEYYENNHPTVIDDLGNYLNILNTLESQNQIVDILTFYKNIQYNFSILVLLIRLVYIKDIDENKILDRIGKMIYYNPFEIVNLVMGYLKEKGYDPTKCESFGDAYYISISVREEEDFLKDVDFSLLNGYNISEFILRNREYVVPKLKDYLKNKNNKLKVGRYSEEYKQIFAEYLDRVYYLEVSYIEWQLLEQILNKEFGITKVEFNTKEFILLYRYFMTHDKDIISSEAYKLISKKTDKRFKTDLEHDKIPDFINYNIEDPSYIQILYDESIEKGKQIKYRIDMEYAYKHYEEIKSSNYKSCIYIDFGTNDPDEFMTFIDFERAHKFYEGIHDYVERFNFTPLEKYIFTYLLASIFKEYHMYKDSIKEDNKYSEMARNKYYIIYHDFIVCEGYTNFLTTIHSLVGINSVKLSICPPESRDYHSRIMTYLVDPKYNIDGIYIGDPTNDSPYYSLNHAFMTKDKKDYDKYQGKNEDARVKFHYAMALLGFNYPKFDFTKEESFDILSREISPLVIKEALTNMFNKMHPFKTDDEIESAVLGILEDSNLPYINPTYDYKTKLGECDFSIKKYSLLIEDYNLNAKIYEADSNHFQCIYGFTIALSELQPLELLDILEKSNLKDNHMNFLYSKSTGYCSIRFSFLPEETVEDFQKIVNEGLRKISIYLGVYKEEEIAKSNETALMLVPQNKNN